MQPNQFWALHALGTGDGQPCRWAGRGRAADREHRPCSHRALRRAQQGPCSRGTGRRAHRPSFASLHTRFTLA